MKRLAYSFTRRVVIFSVLLLIVFSLSACSKKQSESKEIKIGAILPLTGDGAIYGQMARKAIDLAVEEINNEGGIEGKKLIVVYEDTQLKPQVATQVAQKLITVDKVPIVVGPMASNTLLAIAPIVEKNQVVLISPSATSHEITNAGDYIFRTVVSDIYDGTAMAQFAYRKLDFRKVAVFYVDEAGPRGVSKAFINEFKRFGGTISTEEQGTRDGTDFRTQITKLKDSAPYGVYFAGYAKETVIFLRQAKELGLNKQLMTHQLIDDPDVLKRAGETANGVIFTTPKLTPETGGKAVREFFEKFQNKYGEEPQNFAPNSYDAVVLIARAIKKYGPNAESIKRGLYEVENFQGASGIITIDNNGDVQQKMQIMRVYNQEAVPLSNLTLH